MIEVRQQGLVGDVLVPTKVGGVVEILRKPAFPEVGNALEGFVRDPILLLDGEMYIPSETPKTQ